MSVVPLRLPGDLPWRLGGGAGVPICPNYSAHAAQCHGWGGRLVCVSWQVSFPGTRQGARHIIGDPQLEIRQCRQPPPMFLTMVVRGLELVEQEFPFAKAKEMLQFRALPIGFMDVEQRQFHAALADDDQPERLLKHDFALVIVAAEGRQRKRMLVHGFALPASHEQVVPGLELHSIGKLLKADEGGFCHLVGSSQVCGSCKSKGVPYQVGCPLPVTLGSGAGGR